MGDVSFNGKINTNGIKKEDFIKQFDNEAMKTKAGSIFDRFNTNTDGESANILDEKEQAALLAFMKKMAGEDTTITSDEFTSNSSLASTFGIESFDDLTKIVNAYDNSTDNGKAVKFGGDNKSVTVGGNTYFFDGNAAYQSETATGENGVTRRNKQKHDPVHLTANWHMKRIIANDTEGKYSDAKTKTTAAEVLDSILAKKGITVDDAAQKEKLLKTFIKFNPSVFDRETGNVWLDADWSKLDFPEETEVGSMVSDDVDLSDVKTSSYGDWYAYSANFTDKDLTGKKDSAGHTLSPARYVLNQVMESKMGGILSDEDKAKLLSHIIKANPDVFKEDGSLVEGADISKLKIPTMNWIKAHFGVTANEKGQFNTRKGNDTVSASDGSHAVKENGVWKYYDASGKPIDEKDFRKRYPNVYHYTRTNTWLGATNKQGKSTGPSELKSTKDVIYAPDGSYLRKENGTWVCYGTDNKKLSDDAFRKKYPNSYHFAKTGKWLDGKDGKDKFTSANNALYSVDGYYSRTIGKEVKYFKPDGTPTNQQEFNAHFFPWKH